MAGSSNDADAYREAFSHEGGEAARVAWEYMVQCMNINKVAWNFARRDEIEQFERWANEDPQFHELVFQWERLYRKICCGGSNAALRLKSATQIIECPYLDFPPRGPPLLAGDAVGGEVQTPAFLDAEAAREAFMRNFDVVASPAGQPLRQYILSLVKWMGYASRQGFSLHGGPPGTHSIWVTILHHAFFGYVCENCHQQFLHLHLRESSSDTSLSSTGSSGRSQLEGSSSGGSQSGGGSAGGGGSGGGGRGSGGGGRGSGGGGRGSGGGGRGFGGGARGEGGPGGNRPGGGPSRRDIATTLGIIAPGTADPLHDRSAHPGRRGVEPSGNLAGTTQAQETRRGFPAARPMAGKRQESQQHGARRTRESGQAGGRVTDPAHGRRPGGCVNRGAAESTQVISQTQGQHARMAGARTAETQYRC